MKKLIERARRAYEEAVHGGANSHLHMFAVVRDLANIAEPSNVEGAFNQSSIFKSGLLHLEFGMLMMDPNTDVRTLVRFAEENNMKLSITIAGDTPDVQTED